MNRLCKHLSANYDRCRVAHLARVANLKEVDHKLSNRQVYVEPRHECSSDAWTAAWSSPAETGTERENTDLELDWELENTAHLR